MISERNDWLVEGHVELQMSIQSFSSVQRACKRGDAHAAEARVGPSILVKMWVWMMSGWTAEIPPEVGGGGEEGMFFILRFVDV